MNLIAPPFSWKWSSCTQRASQKHWSRRSVFMIAGLICVFPPKKNTPGDKCQVMKVSQMESFQDGNLCFLLQC